MSRIVQRMRDSRNKYRVIININEDWQGFDNLIQYLQVNYSAKILNSADGPDARRWIVEVQDQTIEVIHDDFFGNYFLAPTLGEEKLIDEIGNDIEERLKNINID